MFCWKASGVLGSTFWRGAEDEDGTKDVEDEKLRDGYIVPLMLVEKSYKLCAD